VARLELGGDQGGETLVGEGRGSPRRGGVHHIQLEAKVGGIKVHHLPLVAKAETTGGSRDLQATTAATAVAGEELGRERERRVSEGSGLGWSNRPRTWRLG
jgi:hypothetical protein